MNLLEQNQTDFKEPKWPLDDTLDGTLNCNLDELALLRYVKDNPAATQIEIAKHIGKSERTVKRMTPTLIERGLLERENGKRNGKWMVKCEI